MTSTGGRRCLCGIGDHPGMPWPEWHRLHTAHHLAAFPDVDDRTRDNLRMMEKLPNAHTQPD